jgi:hypothetical protein
MAGAVVLLAVGGPSQATVRREEVRKSFAEAMVTCCVQERGRRRGRASRLARSRTLASSDGHQCDMHGHFGPHLGEAAVLEARYVEVGLAWELAELGREQDGAGELGDGSNGAAVTRLALRARARRRRGGKNGELVKEGAGAAVLEASARGVLRTATRRAALTRRPSSTLGRLRCG